MLNALVKGSTCSAGPSPVFGIMGIIATVRLPAAIPRFVGIALVLPGRPGSGTREPVPNRGDSFGQMHERPD